MATLTKEQWDSFESRYRAGESSAELRREFKAPSSTVSTFLRKRNVPLQSRSYAMRRIKKYKINENCFKEIAEESAYWTGMLLADGCIKGNNLVLSLQARDSNHLEKFKNFLSTDYKIKNRNYKNEMVELKICNETIIKDLNNLGITERKSFTAKVASILEDDKNFWRGFCDGNGCLDIPERWWVRKRDGIKVFHKIERLRIYGSEFITAQFSKFANKHIDKQKRILKHGPIFSVQLAGKDAKKISEILYSNANIYLNRKKEIADDIISGTWKRAKLIKLSSIPY